LPVGPREAAVTDATSLVDLLAGIWGASAFFLVLTRVEEPAAVEEL
jgi:hypothetical protein